MKIIVAILIIVIVFFAFWNVQRKPDPPIVHDCDEIQNGGSIPFRVLNCAWSIPQSVYWAPGVENDIRTLFERLHPKRVFDVGCNQGYYSLMSAAMGAEVTCFEMQPKCLELVDLQKRINGLSFEVVRTALGNRDGFVSTNAANCDGGHTYDPNPGKVPLQRFDDLVSPVRTDIVKIDTEGSEIDILKGMTKFVQSGLVEHFVIEFAPARWNEKGITIEDGSKIVQTLFAAYDAFPMDDVYPDLVRDTKPETYHEILKGLVIYETPKNWEAFFRNRGGRGTNVLFKRHAV